MQACYFPIALNDKKIIVFQLNIFFDIIEKKLFNIISLSIWTKYN
jgi:hypothetical protein